VCSAQDKANAKLQQLEVEVVSRLCPVHTIVAPWHALWIGTGCGRVFASDYSLAPSPLHPSLSHRKQCTRIPLVLVVRRPRVATRLTSVTMTRARLVCVSLTAACTLPGLARPPPPLHWSTPLLPASFVAFRVQAEVTAHYEARVAAYERMRAEYERRLAEAAEKADHDKRQSVVGGVGGGGGALTLWADSACVPPSVLPIPPNTRSQPPSRSVAPSSLSPPRLLLIVAC
jgi:hypothetical protein